MHIIHLTQISNSLLTWLAIFRLKPLQSSNSSLVESVLCTSTAPAPTQVTQCQLRAAHREEPQIPDKRIGSTVVFPLTSEYAGMNHVILKYLPVLLLQLLVSV